MTAFCPKCGATKGKFIHGFCEKCFLEDHELISLPAELEIQKCPVCGKVKLSGKWEAFTPKNLKKFVEAKAKVKELLGEEKSAEIGKRENGTLEAVVKARGKIGTEEIETERHSTIKFVKESCDSCNRVAGGYFEATIQIRWKKPGNSAKRGRVLKEIEFALSLQGSDSLARIVRIEEKKNGFDARIGSNSAARLAVSRLRKKFKEKAVTSSKLAGVTRDGRKKTRLTYCFRL